MFKILIHKNSKNHGTIFLFKSAGEKNYSEQNMKKLLQMLHQILRLLPGGFVLLRCKNYVNGLGLNVQNLDIDVEETKSLYTDLSRSKPTKKINIGIR